MTWETSLLPSGWGEEDTDNAKPAGRTQIEKGNVNGAQVVHQRVRLAAPYAEALCHIVHRFKWRCPSEECEQAGG